MKIIKTTTLVLALTAMFTSCTVSHTAYVTNNPVGSKTGEINETPFFNSDFDLSFETAMKKGDISKVGVAEMKVKVMIIPFYKFTVTGE